MKKFLSFTLALIFVLAASFEVFGATDLDGHYAKTQIENFLRKNYISGYPDGSVKPENPMTRAEFYSVVNKVFGYNEFAPISFSDVSPSDWYYNDITKAMAAGILINGSTAQPNKQITREEVAVILTYVSGITPFEPGALPFSDVDISWSRSYIGAVANAGLMRGYTDNTFKPYNTISRAEAVIVLTAAQNKYMGRDLSYVAPVESNVAAIASIPAETYQLENRNSTLEQSDWEFAKTITSSSYGDGRKDEDLYGNVLLDANSCYIRDIDIQGDLVISTRVNGVVDLVNVYVSGNIYVLGNPSIFMENSEAIEIVVNGTRNETAITLQGSSVVEIAKLYSPTSLYENKLTSSSYGFSYVFIEADMPSGSLVTLAGNFDNVEVHASRIELLFSKGETETLNIEDDAERCSIEIRRAAVINYTEINGRYTEFSGTGEIETAYANVRGTTFSVRPKTVFGEYEISYGSEKRHDDDSLLEVYVTDEYGDPCRDAEVNIYYDYGNQNLADSGYTNSDGMFYSWLSNDYYLVEVIKSNYSNVERSVRIYDYNESIDIKLGTSNRGGVNVSVVEKTTNGTDYIRGAFVYIMDYDGTTIASATTDSYGDAIFNNIVPGNYSVVVEKSGYRDKSLAITIRRQSRPEDVTIELRAIQ